MHQITRDQCVEWLRGRGLDLSSLDFPVTGEMKEALEVVVPLEGGPASALAAFIGELERDAFSGGIVCLRDWSLGSPELERIGHKCVSLMICGDKDVDSNQPLFLLSDSSDAVSIQVFLLQAMLFHWDAFYVPNSAAFVVFLSNDELLYIVEKSPMTDEEVAFRFPEPGARKVSTPPFLSKECV